MNPDSNTRRPSLILTGKNTQACQQTAVWTSHLISPSFGQISGFADTATCTTNSQFSALNLQNNEQISSAESQSGVFVVNKSLSHDSLILYKT